MRTTRNITQHELIGLKAEVTKSKNPANVGLAGKIINETQHTLVLDVKGKDKRLFKESIHFQVLIEGKKIEIDGKVLEGKPWERIKKNAN